MEITWQSAHRTVLCDCSILGNLVDILSTTFNLQIHNLFRWIKIRRNFSRYRSFLILKTFSAISIELLISSQVKLLVQITTFSRGPSNTLIEFQSTPTQNLNQVESWDGDRGLLHIKAKKHSISTEETPKLLNSPRKKLALKPSNGSIWDVTGTLSSCFNKKTKNFVGCTNGSLIIVNLPKLSWELFPRMVGCMHPDWTPSCLISTISSGLNWKLMPGYSTNNPFACPVSSGTRSLTMSMSNLVIWPWTRPWIISGVGLTFPVWRLKCSRCSRCAWAVRRSFPKERINEGYYTLLLLGIRSRNYLLILLDPSLPANPMVQSTFLPSNAPSPSGSRPFPPKILKLLPSAPCLPGKSFLVLASLNRSTAIVLRPSSPNCSRACVTP